VGLPQGENSMAVSGLSYRNVLVGITWWAISLLLYTNLMALENNPLTL